MKRLFLLLSVGFVVSGDHAVAQSKLPALTHVTVDSTLDDEKQHVLFWAPKAARKTPTPLFVFLHSWSSDYQQDNSKWQKEAVERGWIYLHPDFRGANVSPKACGSKFARQDVLDAMDWACEEFQVDRSRIHLAGVSGGGHMAMLMAGHHPDRFSSVSAWVGISDLPAWYQFHVKDGQPQKYAQMILKCFGAPPGSSPEVDSDYRDRSPLFHIHNVGELPIDIYAGVNDGHTGSVPVRHSLTAFNRIAQRHGTPLIPGDEIHSLWTDRKLQNPQPSDLQPDKALGRKILLRRNSRNARVTIFDGGHESLPVAACDWLATHGGNDEE